MQSILPDLMPELDADKTRRPVHSTVTPELENTLRKLAKESRGMGGVHIAGLSSAIARVLETAEMLGWLESADAFKRVYMAALTKAESKKKP